MAYLNENNPYTFVDNYLARCSQVQRAADSNPMYQQEQPVIVLDDDEDEETQTRLNSTRSQHLHNSTVNFRQAMKSTNSIDVAESSDLRITGVGVLREWIDISELDLGKYAYLAQSEARRCRNSTEKRLNNGHVNKERRNRREIDESHCTDVEIVEQNEKTKKQNFEEIDQKRATLLKSILEGGRYKNSVTSNEATKLIVLPESPTKTEESDMTWADLNVEEDIDDDEEKPAPTQETENVQTVEKEPVVQAEEKEPVAQSEETEPAVQSEETEPAVQSEETESAAQSEATEEKSQTENEKAGKYKCAHCPYRTDWKSNMTKHVVSRHQSSEEIRWYECAHCAYRGKTREYLRIHLRINHEQFFQWFSCDSCPFKSKTKQMLQQHALALHTAPGTGKWFQCDQCDYKSLFKGRLKIHKKNMHLAEHEIRWFQCQHCKYKGKTRKGLNRHTLNMHKSWEDMISQKCEKCDFECVSKIGLKLHVRMRHSEEAESRREKIPDDVTDAELECEMCGFKTRSKMEFQEHVRFEGLYHRRMRDNNVIL